jgi:hypothetical protein
MSGVYFDFQGKLPPNGGRYIAEVAKKDANGADRSPIESRIIAWSILITGLGINAADVQIRQEIEKGRFDKMVKEQVFQGPNGTIYRVIQEPP